MTIGGVLETGYADHEIQMIKYRQNNAMTTRF